MGEKSSSKTKKQTRRLASLIILLAALAVLIIALWQLIPTIMEYREATKLYEDLAGEVVDLGPNRSDTMSDSGSGSGSDTDLGSASDTGADADGDSGTDTGSGSDSGSSGSGSSGSGSGSSGSGSGSSGSGAYDEPDTYDWRSVTIDFDKLKAINPDVVGWIRFDHTDTINVDYPILYDTNNSTYLRTDLYGGYLYSGSIFLECTDSPDLSDVYNIIYGHNMKNGSMFGTLRKYRDKSSTYENNKYFTIYTPTAAYRYKIFAYGDVSATSAVFMSGFVRNAAYQQLINRIAEVTSSNTGIEPTIDDDIVCLSTCTASGETYRFVVFGMVTDTYVY